MQGLQMALSRDPLPAEVFEAVATTPEEAEALHYKDARARLRAQAKAQIGW